MTVVSLPHLRAARSAAKAELDGILAGPQAEQRNLTGTEQTTFNEKLAEIRGLDDQIGQAETAEQRAGTAATIRSRIVPNGPQNSGFTITEPTTYRKDDLTGPSWVRDMTAVALRSDSDAAQRLQRNTREVAQETRALTTTDGAGGEFVPPMWVVNEAVMLARAGRVVADQVRHQPLPSGTDTISLPRMVSGTTVAEQATQNTAVSNTDATTGSVTANVATIAGQQVISQQLIEQSPVNMDTVLLADLVADYAVKLDTYVISNNAAGKRGLLNVTGINGVTYTDATPTVGEAYSKVADGIQQIHTGRFLPPDKIFMHPRRWAWYTASLDTAGRPLVVPVANMPQNTLAAMGSVVSEGFVGTLQGLPVFVDPNLPTNLGAGTNEDRIIVARTSDVILYEGVMRAEAFRETYAHNLSVLLRVYNYAAIHSERYPKSISVVSGTGLIAPTF